MKVYTEIEKAIIGEKLAKILCLKKDREYKDRYQMAWGNKTARGVFETLKRIGNMIENGEEIKAGE